MLKGIVLIVLAAAFWGLGGVAGQYLFQYHQVDAVWLVMVRQIVAGGMFLLYTAAVLFLRGHIRGTARLLLYNLTV